METKLIAWHVFEQCDGDEDNEVKPMLAKDYDEEDDGLTYVLHLREDVKFHEGSTMESEDASIHGALERGCISLMSIL